MNLSEQQLRDLAQSWRDGASDVRAEFRDTLGKVRPDVEAGASAIESCAARLESIAGAKLLPSDGGDASLKAFPRAST